MTDSRIAHYQKLLKEYTDAMAAVHVHYGTKLNAYKRKLIKDGCPHPDIHTYIIDRDNGYGRWWKNRVHKCRVCDEVIKVDYQYEEGTDATNNTPF